MKKVLVIGATGGTGVAITQELLRRGIDTTVFGRSEQRLQRAFPETPYAVGDVFKPQDLIDAIQTHEIDTLFQCAAIPYSQTVKRQVPLGQSVMEAAFTTQTQVAFIDGIYAYGDVRGQATEATPLAPVSRKGLVKKQLSDLLFSPSYATVNTVLFRLPDYYGPSARQASYLGGTLMGIARKRPTFYIGDKHQKREYVYLPDAAKMMVTIAAEPTAYNQAWNIPGQIISGKKLLKFARRLAGTHVPVFTMTRPLIGLVGRFNPDVAEMREMYYLTKHPVYLSPAKYRAKFGEVVRTPIKTGLMATIMAYEHKD